MQSCRVLLPKSVNFEVPRDYAVFCRGHPMRVVPCEHVESDVLVTWAADVLSFTHGGTVIECDLTATYGLLLNTGEEISGMLACTLRVVLAVADGGTTMLPLFSANPAYMTVFCNLVERLRGCGLPVPIRSSLPDLLVRQPPQ